MSDVLAAYLSGLGAEELTALFARRPEALLPPQPTTMESLATRLAAPHAIRLMLFDLTLPQAQVTEALAALGDGCRRADLADLFRVAHDDASLMEILDSLASLAVAWRDGERIRTVPLAQAWPQPLRLGSSLRRMVGSLRIDDVRKVARELGVPAVGAKEAMVGKIVEAVSNADRVRELVETSPKATRDLLHKVAWEGPFVNDHGFAYGGRASAPAAWAVDRGLLGSDGTWGARLEMPSEVALALRGPDYCLTLDASAPTGEIVSVRAEDIEREAAAAAGTALARF